MIQHYLASFGRGAETIAERRGAVTLTLRWQLRPWSRLGGVLAALLVVAACASAPAQLTSTASGAPPNATAVPLTPTTASNAPSATTPTTAASGAATTNTPTGATTNTPTAAVALTATPPMVTGPTPGGAVSSSFVVPTAVLPLVTLIRSDLASRAKVAEPQISAVSVAPATWPDGSLGCPQPGMMYPQIVTPGYRVVLQANGTTYEYHTDRGQRFVYCANPKP